MNKSYLQRGDILTIPTHTHQDKEIERKKRGKSQKVDNHKLTIVEEETVH